MIIRRHVVELAAYGVREAVVAHVDEDIHIHTADGLADDAFGFAGTEAGAFGLNQVSVAPVGVVPRLVEEFVFAGTAPRNDEIIDFLPNRSAALEGDDAQRCKGTAVNKLVFL